MCWNSDISLNTFLFACFALTFIFITNTFTKYKSSTFENPLVYLFIFEISLVQFIEFFFWRNLKNKDVNTILAKVMSHVIIAQIATLILMVKTEYLKYPLLLVLAVTYLAIVYYSSFIGNIKFHASVGENGHLVWEWMNFKGFENIFLFIFLLLYIIPTMLLDNIKLALLLMVSLFASLFFYYKYKTWGSMWCWIGNVFLLYFVVDILLIKPFYEYNGLC
jgi:hypothetical protein